MYNMGGSKFLIYLYLVSFWVLSDGKRQPVPGFHVEAVDTTGAGDCFNGALAVALARGLKLVEAARYANAAAALAVTRFGAQTSMPTDEEVQEFIG